MVAPEPKTKIKLVRDCVIPAKDKEGNIDWNQPLFKAGHVAEVDADVAKELCDTQFSVPPQRRGETTPNDVELNNKIFRAVRVN